MRKYRFLFIIALFIILPFSVNAEVITKGDTVYVMENIEFNCKGAEDPYYDYSKVQGKLLVYDDFDGENYLYDLATDTCSLIDEKEVEEYEIDIDVTRGYKIKNNEIYYFEKDDNLHSYDVVSDTSETGYIEKHFIYVFGNVDTNGTYYKYDGNGIASLVSEEDVKNGYCYSNNCLIEVDYLDYYKEESVAQFASGTFVVDEYDMVIGNMVIKDADIRDYFVFDEEEYLIISGRTDGDYWYYLYTIDGELIFKGVNINVLGDKYLFCVTKVDDSLEVRIYNSEFEIIYEKVVTENNILESLPIITYLEDITIYDNNVIVYKESIVDSDGDNMKEEYSYMAIREYKILSENNNVFKNEDLQFRFSGEFNKLKNVKINDNILSSDKYDAKSGSTIITLKREYLKTLKEGNYTLKVEYSDGGYSETTFTVGSDVKNPNTFDGIGSSILMGIISLIGLIGAIIYFKKRNKVRA